MISADQSQTTKSHSALSPQTMAVFSNELCLILTSSHMCFDSLGFTVVVAPELNLLHTIHYPAICEDDSELSWLSKYTVVPFDPQDTQGTVLLGDHVYWQISSRIGLAMFLMCLVKVGAILFELLRPKLKRSYQKEFFFYFSLYIVY